MTSNVNIYVTYVMCKPLTYEEILMPCVREFNKPIPHVYLWNVYCVTEVYRTKSKHRYQILLLKGTYSITHHINPKHQLWSCYHLHRWRRGTVWHVYLQSQPWKPYTPGLSTSGDTVTNTSIASLLTKKGDHPYSHVIDGVRCCMHEILVALINISSPAWQLYTKSTTGDSCPLAPPIPWPQGQGHVH